MEFSRDFIEQLAATPARGWVFNPYAGDDARSRSRRHNLSLYLQLMYARRPSLLLVGEAPGYRGCRVTGVPFTSEAILLSHSPPFGLFGPSAGFQNCGEHDKPLREATATILWESLVELAVIPLLWNAFPLHPHQPGRPASNRPPGKIELNVGRVFISELLAMFSIQRVIAVGNKATTALHDWGIPASKVRHPGHGGKVAFRQQLESIIWQGLR